MAVNFKIVSWNLCLGLANKKDYETETLHRDNIDLCCMQEIELKTDFNHELLYCRGHSLLVEKNTVKSRCGIYVRSVVKYSRREEVKVWYKVSLF